LALLIGVSAMLACALQFTFLPGALPSWVTLFVFGVSSGAAMIPYTIIKEVNPDNVKGSATGTINFITFSVTALLGPVFSKHIGKTIGAPAINPELHFFQSGLFWVAVIALALLVSLTLRETGRKAIGNS